RDAQPRRGPAALASRRGVRACGGPGDARRRPPRCRHGRTDAARSTEMAGARQPGRLCPRHTGPGRPAGQQPGHGQRADAGLLPGHPRVHRAMTHAARIGKKRWRTWLLVLLVAAAIAVAAWWLFLRPDIIYRGPPIPVGA